jgi:helix-turn-helix protein
MSGYAVGHVLRTSHASGTSLLVLIVIAEATHQDGTGAWPAVASIAQLARTTERSVYRVLRQLEKAGELVVDRGAGPHGTNLYSIPGVGQLRLGDDTPVTPDKASPLTTGASGDDTGVTPPLTTAASGDDTAVSPEPSVPVLYPSKNRSRAARAQGIEIPTRPQTTREIEREQHAFARQAEEVWLQTAAKTGSMYTDRAALRMVHEHAINALRWATTTQVLAAIRGRAEAKTTPRRIEELARYEASDDAQRDARASGRTRVDEVIEGGAKAPAGLHHIGTSARRVLTVAAGART